MASDSRDHWHADHRDQPRMPQRDRAGFGRQRVDVDDARRHLAVGQLGHQRGRAVEGGSAAGRVDAPLVARGRLRE